MELCVIKIEKTQTLLGTSFVLPCIYSHSSAFRWNILAVSELPGLGVFVRTFECSWQVTRNYKTEKRRLRDASVPFPTITHSSGSRLVCLTDHLYRMLPAFVSNVTQVGCVFLSPKWLNACANIGAVKCCLLKTEFIKTCSKSNRQSASSFIEENQFKKKQLWI